MTDLWSFTDCLRAWIFEATIVHDSTTLLPKRSLPVFPLPEPVAIFSDLGRILANVRLLILIVDKLVTASVYCRLDGGGRTKKEGELLAGVAEALLTAVPRECDCQTKGVETRLESTRDGKGKERTLGS
jgi:hypothetical protein